ncbi:cytochrome c-type biogenesis protein CcmH [Variovorax sp. GT1P44]|uniref:cytochrome c-type biogenesis protein CcmH n=1 Tax=Variovorax sp. GT1P44 TaxID=3443742 RepID=UPI003F4659A7
MARLTVAACILALAAWGFNTAHGEEALPLAPNPVLEASVMEIAGELRCLVCQNETIAASQSALAADLRAQIARMLEEGQSRAQILDFMVDRYGEFVRFRPAFEARTLLLWLGPFALLGATLCFIAVGRRRRAPGASRDGEVEVAAQAKFDPADPLPHLSRSAVAWLSAGVAVFSIGVYARLGNLDALAAAPEQAASAAPAESAQALEAEAMLDGMAARMEQQRAGSVDAAGWAMLARSYAATGRFENASRAFERALALQPDDAQLLADSADVLTMLNGRRSGAKAASLIARALEIDPDNLKALALAGSDAMDRHAVDEATAYWSKARQLTAPGAFADSMDANLNSARTASGR